MRCSFCPPSSRPGGFMSKAEFDRILDQISPFCQYIYLHVKGEPLFHPLLGRFLETAAQKGFLVNITTNGTLLREQSHLLLSSPAVRQVQISLHSFGEPGSGDETNYLEALADFGQAAAKLGRPYVTYRLWNALPGENISADSLTRLSVIASRFGVILPSTLSKGREAAHFADNVYVSFAERFEWPSLSLPVTNPRGRCLGAVHMIGILCDGTVVPCCLDSEAGVPLGNIFKQDLADILSSARFTALREGFLQGKPSEKLCMSCPYRQRFIKNPHS